MPLCTSFEGDGQTNTVQAFDEAMKDADNSRDCENMCLPNCDETTFEATIDTTELNTDELCSNAHTREVAIYVPTYRNLA